MAEKQGNWFKKHKILTAVLVIAGIAIIASAAGGGNTGSNAGSSPPSASGNENKAQTAKIGQAARDGKFEFTVNSLKCGEKSVGSQYVNRKAQGQFCRVNISVKNIGDEQQTLDGSSQYAYNAQNQKYSADDEAAIYAATDNNSTTTWYNDINPGNTVKGDLFFDVPVGEKPVKVELHDSAFSGGVTVSLD